MSIISESPESQGISSVAISSFIDKIEKEELQVISLVLLRNGKTIDQFCKKPYNKDGLQLLFSLTKSFTGIGIGIASDKGIISLEDSVASFFPDKLPQIVSANLEKMKIRHLLTMSCGIHENTYGQLYSESDWVKAFLAQDLQHEPGTFYRYSTHATYMLAAIIERVTGKSFYSFIKEHLLKPLDIKKSSWEVCKQGITAGGMGLGLTTESVAKFGQMLLNKGMFNGKRIVSEDFISLATSFQISKGKQEKVSRSKEYGFQIHIDKEDDCFFGDGAFGQLCYISEKHNVVLAVNSRKSNVDSIINLLWENILNNSPFVPLPDSDATEKLIQRLNNLSYPLPVFKPVHNDKPFLNGKYSIEINIAGLVSIDFLQRNINELKMHLCYSDRDNSKLKFYFDKPAYGYDVFIKDIQLHKQSCVTYASWEKDVLTLTVFYIETPYVVTYNIEFHDEQLDFCFEINASLTLKNFKCKGKKSCLK